MAGLLIDVSELAGRPGASRHISLAERLSGLRMPLGWVRENEFVEIALDAESVVEGVRVTGDISGRVHLSCSRCLVEFEQKFSHDVDETYRFRGGEVMYQIADNQLDLEPLIRDFIVLNIPPSPLHDPGCRGLCPTCGADRNAIDCGHEQRLEDLRWEPLRSLVLNDQEEA